MPGKIKDKLKRKMRLWRKMIFNWRFLICIGIGWIITNGWSYAMLGVGVWLEIPWMIAVSSAYLAFLWFPFTPEKIVTVSIALFLVKVLFPKHNEKLREDIKMYSDAEFGDKDGQK